MSIKKDWRWLVILTVAVICTVGLLIVIDKYGLMKGTKSAPINIQKQ